MDGSRLAHLLRRSRLRSFAAGPGHVNVEVAARSPNESSLDHAPGGVEVGMEKRQAILDSNNPHVHSGAGAAASSTKTVGQAVATSTQRQAAQAATVGTTRTTVNVVETQTRAASSGSAKATLEAVTSSSKKTIDFGPATTSSSAAPQTSATPSTTSTTPASTSAAPSATSTSAVPSTTSTTSRSTTSITSSSSTSSASASVRAITSTISATSANPTSTLDAAKAGSSSSGMSTGAVVGIALGAIVGLVVVGSLIGWLYRKWTARSYNSQAPWSKIDDDITPFPHNGSNEKFERYTDGNDDIYGGSVAPVIGSRRALAMARDNAFNHDGSLHDSGMYDNRAGVGAGGQPAAYSPYPQFSPESSGVAAYGLDAQGRPYNGQAGRTPMPHTYENQYVNDPYYDNSPPPANSRQLVGASAHPYADVPMPTPVPMGRPAAPTTAAEFAQMEDFADEPEPLTPGLAYAFDEPHTPTGDGRVAGRSRVSMTTPQAPRVLSPTESVQAHDYIPAPPLAVPAPAATSASASTSLAPMPLPQFAPLSPLMNDFDFKRKSQPLPMYEDDASVQKRMYGEVATTAGISEPVTPASAQPSPNPQASGLNDSTNSTDSSFSATVPYVAESSVPSSSSLPRLPDFTLAPPQPYQHGQPLSPLNEVPTPLSTASNGEALLNPFDLPTPRLRAGGDGALAPPFTASTSGATGFPSPAYPPPSPGGMSVPGSVTDSPRRWDSSIGTPKGRAVSVNYDEEDAYGGI
ncbi:hypothetical protein IAU59_004865 [Kwoniella sp. CBS 9459]